MKQEDGQKILKKLTIHLLETYKKCSKNFNYQIKPRILTNPSIPSFNGFDNLEGNLILSVNDILMNKYTVQDMLVSVNELKRKRVKVPLVK
jgi:hypothetical protein